MSLEENINVEPFNLIFNFLYASIFNTEPAILTKITRLHRAKALEVTRIFPKTIKTLNQVIFYLFRIWENSALKARLCSTCHHPQSNFWVSGTIHSHSLRTYRRQMGLLAFPKTNKTRDYQFIIKVIRLTALQYASFKRIFSLTRL